MAVVEKVDNLSEQLVKYEQENARLICENNEIVRKFNEQMKIHLQEVCLLKEVNERLQHDLKELRDLCCYLDDDRHKCRRLAKEWQHFGHHVSSMLQSKESYHQDEMQSFNSQKQTIMTENNKLRKLCDELEKQRKHNEAKEYICRRCLNRQILPDSNGNIEMRKKPPSYEEVVINQSEQRLMKSDNKSLFADVPSKVSNITKIRKRVSFAESEETINEDDGQQKHVPHGGDTGRPIDGILRNSAKKKIDGVPCSPNKDLSVSIPEAMQVLTIHSELERNCEQLKEKEVALLQEMCNVAWRKLSNDDRFNGNSKDKHDEIIYEDLL